MSGDLMWKYLMSSLPCEVEQAGREIHWNFTKFLIDRNCELNKLTDGNESTALSLACIGNHKDVVEVLLRAGAVCESLLEEAGGRDMF